MEKSLLQKNYLKNKMKKSKKHIELKTERLLLRPIEKEDAQCVFKYRSDSVINQYQGWIPETIGDVNDFIQKIASDLNIPNTWFQFVIIERLSNNIIGDAGVHFLVDRQAEIGCTLDKNYHGIGYATEVLKSVINYLFNCIISN